MKRDLHFITITEGSIGEISKDLIPYFEKEFILTCEHKEEIPIEKDILLCHFYAPHITENEIFYQFKKKILIQPIDGTSITQEVVN